MFSLLIIISPIYRRMFATAGKNGMTSKVFGSASGSYWQAVGHA
jgi:hypothetical protein